MAKKIKETKTYDVVFESTFKLEGVGSNSSYYSSTISDTINAVDIIDAYQKSLNLLQTINETDPSMVYRIGVLGLHS